MKPFEQTKFYLKIEQFLKSLGKYYNKYVTQRANRRKAKTTKNEQLKFTKDLKINFKQQFGIHPDKVIDIMNQVDARLKRVDVTPMTFREHEQFLANQKKINAGEINFITSKKTFVNFYNPDIVDIHNSYLETHPGPDIKQLIKTEMENDGEKLRKVAKMTRK